jgi:ABC-type nitrate/sulfonate/bicarbonate transport system ATPase subunit
VIGCVAQKSGVDVSATGRENLILQGRFHGLGGADLHARVAALFDRFGLSAAADRQARTYSGGMQRKLDIAMGLIYHPRVLFLDEPTPGLDPEARADLWQEIARLAADGISVLLTTRAAAALGIQRVGGVARVPLVPAVDLNIRAPDSRHQTPGGLGPQAHGLEPGASSILHPPSRRSFSAAC